MCLQAGIDAVVKDSVETGFVLYRIDEAAVVKARPNVIVTQDLCSVCAPTSSDVASALLGVCAIPSNGSAEGDSPHLRFWAAFMFCIRTPMLFLSTIKKCHTLRVAEATLQNCTLLWTSTLLIQLCCLYTQRRNFPKDTLHRNAPRSCSSGLVSQAQCVSCRHQRSSQQRAVMIVSETWTVDPR